MSEGLADIGWIAWRRHVRVRDWIARGSPVSSDEDLVAIGVLESLDPDSVLARDARRRWDALTSPRTPG